MTAASFKGDFSKLAQLRRQMSSLSRNDTHARLATVIGAAALAEVQLGFREGRDPYGRSWKPLQLRASGKPLLDTGRLRSSFSARVRTGGFDLGTNFIGAGVHQHGAIIRPVRAKFLRFKASRRGKAIYAKQVTIPRRQMIPEGTLGPIWTKAFNETATRFISKLMKP